MPTCASTVRSLPRDLAVGADEEIDALMRRVDRDEVRQVCRHLLGDLEAHDVPAPNGVDR